LTKLTQKINHTNSLGSLPACVWVKINGKQVICLTADLKVFSINLETLEVLDVAEIDALVSDKLKRYDKLINCAEFNAASSILALNFMKHGV
jgi:hypothetical protein